VVSERLNRRSEGQKILFLENLNMRLMLAVFITLVASTASAQVNLTGTWQPKYWTVKMALQQEGDRVWGYAGAQDFWYRGHWDGGRLIIVANNFDPKKPKSPCRPRGVMAVTGKAFSSLTTTWWDEGRPKPLRGTWTRLSPNAGDPVAYPYAAELSQCGSLRTYELVFASGADQMNGTDWPILSAVAETLKQNSGMKIQIAGHTDSTGDAKANQALSERRATTVKRILSENYGADAARITTKGWGSEQAVQDNATEEGRALNRRVEIVLN
jgi:outer membrane protein OmpA-like peptidoglycan-associated protein